MQGEGGVDMNQSIGRRRCPGRTGPALAAAVALGSVLALGCATPQPPEPAVVSAPTPEAPEPAPPAQVDEIGDRGWGYLIDRLVRDGVPRERARRTFQDPRFEDFDGLSFSIAPREPHSMYRNFLKSGSIRLAKQCRAEHARAFENAEKTQNVPASVVAAILHVETGCGRNTGDSVILWRLSRLAMANEPGNLEMNIARNATVKGVRNEVLAQRTRDRAKYLEDLFYPEVRATFEIADRMQIDPLDIRGSGSGAFGYPQFLPTSFLRHGVDGNGDGAVSLYDLDDAAASAARYLSVYGWKPGITQAQKRQVIWHYNRSDAYIDTVLGLAARLDAPDRATKPAKAARAKPGGKKAQRVVASGG